MRPDRIRAGRPGRETGDETGVAGGTVARGDADSLSLRGRDLECDDVAARHDRDLGDVWEVLLSIRDTVENEYAHRLRRIETDLRWVIALLAGLVIALVGAALSGLFGG